MPAGQNTGTNGDRVVERSVFSARVVQDVTRVTTRGWLAEGRSREQSLIKAPKVPGNAFRRR